LAELSRLVSKIIKYSGTSFDKKKIRSKQTDLKRRSELLYFIMEGFESSVSNINMPTFPLDKSFSQHILFTDSNTGEFNSEDKEIDLSKLNSCKDKIDSFIISYTTRFVILKKNIRRGEIIDCIETIQKVFSKQRVKPIILSFAIFEYYLRIYNPFMYSQLHDGRKVLLGEDVFLKVKQPNYYFFRKFLLDETNSILLFPQYRSMILQSSTRDFIQNGFSSKAKRGLFLKLYLEKSILEPKFNHCMDECKKFYPHYIQQINDLTNNYQLSNEDQLSYDTYSLLKTFASDIHKSLVSSDVSEN
jgi:hypothetical protein